MRNFLLGKAAELIQGDVVGVAADTVSFSSVIDSGNHSRAGALFVAIPGHTVDGHRFIDQAFDNGAVAAVVQDPQALGDRPGIVVKNTRKALSQLAALAAGEPGKQLVCAGITGTNGKTTVHFLLYHLLEALGERALRMGTIGTRGPDGWSEPGVLTTPSTCEVQRTLERGVGANVRYAVVETSSHALDQYRVEDVYFDLGVFTNLSEDHLDYHPDMNHYLESKLHLFELIEMNTARGTAGGAVIEIDNPYGKTVAERVSRYSYPVLTYGESSESDVQVTAFQQSMQGSRLTLCWKGQSYSIETSFFGRYNANNLAAVFASGVLLGFPEAKVAEAMRELPPVPGRLEPVGNEKLAVFIDYAHTPDALENALRALRDVSDGQLWVVFGCGGDRDPGRRFGMGRAASSYADRIVVTSDNPRTEDPAKIISDILTTVSSAEFVDPDRRSAIERTLTAAGEGDIVLIAGKGHEDYQILGTERVHFSDQEEVLKCRERGVF